MAIYNNLNDGMFYIKSRMITDDKIGSPLRGASFRSVLTPSYSQNNKI